MNSTYLLEDAERLSDKYPVPAFRVHAKAGCGKEFKDVGAILEPDGPNPCLMLNGPLGLNGVKEILNQYYRKYM
jgi:hypothetical protein